MFAPEDVISNGCPSSEWERIREVLALTNQIVPVGYESTYGQGLEPSNFDITGKSSQRQLYRSEMVESKTSAIVPYISTIQQAAVADALTNTSSYWFLSLYNVTARSVHGSSLSQFSNSLHTLTGDNYQPFSLGACLPDSIRNHNDTRPLALPLLQDANDPATANVNINLSNYGHVIKAIVLPSPSRADILSGPGNSSQYRLQWVELPQTHFNSSFIGAIVILPRPVSNLTAPQDIVLCNFAAGWGTTTMQIHQAVGGVSSVLSFIPKEFMKSTRGDHLESSLESIDNLENWEYNQFPQRLTNITQEWARYLNPIVRSANRSVFDIIMQETAPSEPDTLYFGKDSANYVHANSMANVLSSLMVNGLARIGFESTLQGSPKSMKSIEGTSWIDGNYWVLGKGNMFEVDSAQSKEWLKFHVSSGLLGYAYNMETVAPRVAVGVLTLYCTIALAHLFYSGISGT